MARRSSDRRIRTLLVVLASPSLVTMPPFASAGFNEAQEYYEAGDLKAAAGELKGFIKSNDGDLEARILLGRVYLDMRAGPEAEKELRRAEELGADPGRLRLDLADAMLMQGKFLDALRSLEGAGAGTTEDVKAALAVRRSIAYAGLNKAEAAQRSIAEALALDPNNEEALLGQTMMEINEMDSIEGAESAVAAFLKRFPENVDALLISAELHRMTGDFPAALAALDRVLALRPQDLRARYGRAGVLVAQGRPQEARAELDAADTVREKLVMTAYLRGVIALQEKDYEGARWYFDLVLRADPGNVRSLLALGTISFLGNDPKSAEKYLDLVLPAIPDDFEADKVRAAKMLGVTRLRLNEPEKAIEALEPVAARSADARLMALLAKAYLAEGAADRALDWMSRAVEASPDIEMRQAYATLAVERGRVTEALDMAKKLQQNLPDSRAGWELEGDLYLRLKRPGLAVNALEAANRLKRTGAGTIALALAYAENQQHADAMSALEAWLEEQPGYTPAIGYLAELQLEQGQIREAIGTYERLIASSPNNVTALNNLAWLYQEAGDGRARDLARRAHKLAPENPAITDTYGWVLLKSGEVEKALSVLQDAHRAHPDFTSISYHLALALEAAGRRGEAVDMLRRLLRESPDAALAEEARTLLEELE
jgi:tetratricopeptide (TPR) repeat protein